MVLAKLLLLFSLLMIFYVYAGYPVLAFLIAKISPKRIHKSTDHLPAITILIAAFNEEHDIKHTIANKLEQDYPQELLEVIVISDESTDNTDTIVQSFSDPRVRLIRQAPRAGKTSALNLAIPYAQGDILVFSDANSIYEPDALRHLAANFADPDIGYVTGKMLYTTTDDSSVGEGCSAYMKYENRLREIETNLGSVVGVDGGIDAIRKSLYTPLNADQLPDFVQPLTVAEKGFRVIYEPLAIQREEALHDSDSEYRMRVRVTLRALWALKDMSGLLFGKGGAMFSWQLWSHKVLRYQCFLFLCVAVISNMLLVNESLLYTSLLLIQLTCYTLAAITWILSCFGIHERFSRLFYYFVLLNIASLHATLKFLKGEKQVIWKPRTG